MRTLKTADLFTLTRIVKKMNLRSEIKALSKDVTGLSEEEKKKASEGLQTDLVLLFIENIGNAEKEIYKFLGDLSGKSADDIKEQHLMDTVNMINELFSQEGIGDFLSTALK